MIVFRSYLNRFNAESNEVWQNLLRVIFVVLSSTELDVIPDPDKFDIDRPKQRACKGYTATFPFQTTEKFRIQFHACSCLNRTANKLETELSDITSCISSDLGRNLSDSYLYHNSGNKIG